MVSLLTFHKIDTVLITGGSTSGCVRACGVDSLSHGYRTTVIEECVADKHESYHFANLTDLALKYTDVESVDTVKAWLSGKKYTTHQRIICTFRRVRCETRSQFV